MAAGDLLVEADLDAIREAGRATSTVVVFTNGAAIKSVTLTQTGQLPQMLWLLRLNYNL